MSDKPILDERNETMFDNIHEECGVFGMYAGKRMPVAQYAYLGLYALQHRGQ